jgi:gamma-glutamylcyclotransferase (GGCT)/AIG2-like uncharacterized protein YtfP
VALVFVYGTLRRGEANHREIEAGRFVGTARTRAELTLVDLGDYPGLLEGGRDSVEGELYDVDADHLARLDAFEEHPTLFVRRTIHLDDGREVLAYLLPRERAGEGPRIPSGDWTRR